MPPGAFLRRRRFELARQTLLAGAPGTTVAGVVASLGFVPMALFTYLCFEHSLEGVKVVVDDYQGDEGGRMTWHIVSLFLHVGAGALALFALARIAFGA